VVRFFPLQHAATGLVFAKLCFPGSDPLVGTLQAFGIYAVGFVARPVGAAIFGHYGDRIGRKAALIATLLLMGIATFLVAFVPTYAQIGVWGAIILTVLRSKLLLLPCSPRASLCRWPVGEHLVVLLSRQHRNHPAVSDFVA
jgi:MFS family permease